MKKLKELYTLDRLELLAKQIVEGFLIGLHRSPYHGFSSEFREHKIYNTGDSLKSIDFKVLARLDKYFVKKFDEETNLKCSFLLDISNSMYFPQDKEKSKIEFSIVAIASLIRLMIKQRDAFGLFTFGNDIIDIIKPKLSDKNKSLIYNIFDNYLKLSNSQYKQSNIINSLDKIIHIIPKRSIVIVFSDFLDSDYVQNDTFINEFNRVLLKLKYFKNEVIIFNVLKKDLEIDFNFENHPTEFIDVETNNRIKVVNNDLSTSYSQLINKKIEVIKQKCTALNIEFVNVDIDKDYNNILNTFLRKRSKML